MKIIVLILILLPFGGKSKAENMNEYSVSAGITFPQGTFNKYTDNGFYGNIRYISHWDSFKALSGIANLSGSFFSSTTEDVLLTDGSYARKRISEYSGALHLGVQLGSDSRHSFFRPKAGLAGGLYFFNTETLLLSEYSDETVFAKDNQTQFRVGWRGIIGTDLFFTPKWGLSFEFTYDHVLNLHHTLVFDPDVGIKKVGQTARFNSYSIGLILPLPFD